MSCLAALLFVAVLGWHAADHSGTSASPVSSASLTATAGGRVDDIPPGVAHLGDGSTVADQVIVKQQVELERLVAVAAAAVAGLLLLVGRPRRLAAERLRGGRIDRSGWRSRAPPPAFVS